MATETPKHVILHTHEPDGEKKNKPVLRHPDTDMYVSADLEEAKAGCDYYRKKHKGHKFEVYTLIKR